MQTNKLKRKHANTKHVQVGRGGKRGKTAGRGTKGQKARSGHRMRPELRDIIKKIPKKRGHGKNRSKSNYAKVKPASINVETLEKKFDNGATITRASFSQEVKILANGTVTKKFIIQGIAVSEGAKKKIEAAGGSVA